MKAFAKTLADSYSRNAFSVQVGPAMVRARLAADHKHKLLMEDASFGMLRKAIVVGSVGLIWRIGRRRLCCASKWATSGRVEGEDKLVLYAVEVAVGSSRAHGGKRRVVSKRK